MFLVVRQGAVGHLEKCGRAVKSITSPLYTLGHALHFYFVSVEDQKRNLSTTGTHPLCSKALLSSLPPFSLSPLLLHMWAQEHVVVRKSIDNEALSQEGEASSFLPGHREWLYDKSPVLQMWSALHWWQVGV